MVTTTSASTASAPSNTLNRWQQSYLPPAPDAVARLKALPLEAMLNRRQWCGFRLVPDAGGSLRKIPVVATSPEKPASCTDPSTWRTFEEALAGLANGDYTAVGYALNGDAVGVDLDGLRWMSLGQTPTAEARKVVERCGSYAEQSISGHGLHVLVEANLIGRGRRKSSSGIEIYTRQRFFIVTGQQLPDTPPHVAVNQEAVDWLYNRYLPDGADQPHEEQAEKPEKPEIMASVLSAGSVASGFSALSVDDVITKTLPHREGERNDRILDLARGLKFNAGLASADFSTLKPIVRKWHGLALRVIGTKSFDSTWADFIHAFDKARFPLGWQAEAWALQQAKDNTLPEAAEGRDEPQTRLLIGMCYYLASCSGGRFFLSSHRAGALLGMSHDWVLRRLKMLLAEGVLELVEPGNQHRANRYRYVGHPAARVVDAEHQGGA